MSDESFEIKDQLDVLRSIPVDDNTPEEKVDALWRQLMVYKSFTDTELSDSKARRAQAETAREQAQMEAIRTTQLLCAQMKGESETELQETRNQKAQAENIRQQAETELDRSRETRQQADQKSKHIVAEAQEKAQAIENAAHEIAQRETTELRRNAIGEIKGILNRVENMRAAADEELETQRILSNISNIKATSRWLSTGESGSPEGYNGVNEAWTAEAKPSKSHASASKSKKTSASAHKDATAKKPSASKK